MVSFHKIRTLAEVREPSSFTSLSPSSQ